MKFSTANLTFSAATLLLSSSSTTGVHAMVSPLVDCCVNHHGKYAIVSSKKGEYGICTLHGQTYTDQAFADKFCSSGHENPKYKVYATNNCQVDGNQDGIVEADFTLSSSTGNTVSVEYGSCAYVGGTDLNSVNYSTSGDTYVAGGNQSCQNTDVDACTMMGKAANACVVKLC